MTFRRDLDKRLRALEVAAGATDTYAEFLKLVDQTRWILAGSAEHKAAIARGDPPMFLMTAPEGEPIPKHPIL